MHHFVISRPCTKSSKSNWSLQLAPSYFKNAVCRKGAHFLPSWLYVFSHCFHISRLTEMIRTILESADHVEKVAKVIGPPKGLHHTLKMRFAEKVHIFLPSYLYVFSHCNLISRHTIMIRTILELADYSIKISVAMDVPRHYSNIRSLRFLKSNIKCFACFIIYPYI